MVFLAYRGGFQKLDKVADGVTQQGLLLRGEQLRRSEHSGTQHRRAAPFCQGAAVPAGDARSFTV